jgi:AraC-like DNA-binding protein
MISVTPHNLSEILNNRLRQNFFDFTNHQRVEEVKKELTNPAGTHLKILSITRDAGFNSKSAFNTIFKKVKKIIPSQYRRKYLSQN